MADIGNGLSPPPPNSANFVAQTEGRSVLGGGWTRRIGLIATLAIAYFVAVRVGSGLESMAGPAGFNSVFWPANGMAVAALLLGGVGLWPGILIGAALAQFSVGATINSVFGFSIGMTFEVFLGFYVIAAVNSLSANDDRRMLPFPALIATAVIIPAVGVTTLLFSGEGMGILGAGFAPFLSLWLADTAGVLTMLPLTLALFDRDRFWINSADIAELAAIAVATVILSAVVFQTTGTAVIAAVVPFVLFPVVVWGAVRQGLRGGMLSAMIIALMASLGAAGVDVLQGTLRAGDVSATGFAASGFTLESFALGEFSIEGFSLDLSNSGALGYLALQGFVFAIGLCGFAAGTARETAAKRVADLNDRVDELSQAKSEIGQFTVAASQGLQESIRMVGSFAGLLERRYRDELDDEAKEYIDYLTAGARQMSDLVDDLTVMERVEERNSEFSLLNMRSMVGGVIERLDTRPDRASFYISVGDLPQVRGQNRQIRELLTALLSNAIDYRAPDRALEISISAFHRESGWVFAIRDTGIGIAEEYLKTIFEPFRRLHTRNDRPGTGLGLAIGKRVVERHGGKIWAESMVGRGTTIFFELPVVDDEFDELVVNTVTLGDTDAPDAAPPKPKKRP